MFSHGLGPAVVFVCPRLWKAASVCGELPLSQDVSKSLLWLPFKSPLLIRLCLLVKYCF